MADLITIKGNQEVKAHASPHASDESVAPILPGFGGNPSVIWSVEPSTYLNFVPENDGMDCRLIAKGPSGQSTVKVKGFTPTGTPFETDFTMSVVPGDADHFAITFDTPILAE